MTSQRRRSGFTLIEILIVISIIAILASLTTASVQYARVRAWTMATRAQVITIDAAIERYKDDEGRYPGTP